jgi:hypothetical protein
VMGFVRVELEPLANLACARRDEHRDHGRAATPHHPASMTSSTSV